LEAGAGEIIGFEVGIEAIDWRPAATVGLVTGTAVLTEMAAAVTTGDVMGIFGPAF
jgi:hypothetical protein